MHIASGTESKGSVNMCVPVLKKRKALKISTLDNADLDPNAQDDHSPQEFAMTTLRILSNFISMMSCQDVAMA
jgi:hypothetical protein